MTLSSELKDWFHQENRLGLIKAEQALIHRISKNWMTASCLQLAAIADKTHFFPLAMKHCWLADADSPSADLIVDWTALPFSNDSLDNLIIVHVLDRALDKEALMAEASRVLVGGGQVLIFGLNPRSIRCAFWRVSGDWPRTQHLSLISLGSLKKMARLQGFEVKCSGFLNADEQGGRAFGAIQSWVAPIYYLSLRKIQRPLTMKPAASFAWLGSSMPQSFGARQARHSRTPQSSE
jgi:SAM-dependent methyltransferase